VAGALALGQAGTAAAASKPARPQAAVGAAQVMAHELSATTPSKGLMHYGHAAFPSVARLANGTLFVVYRQASNHVAARDGFIRSTTSTDLGRTWSAPVNVIPPARGVDYRDPSVSTSNDGSTLYLTYFKGTRSNGAAGSFFRSSTDGGATWSEKVRIDPELPYSAITAPAVQLADGTLVTVHYSRRAGESRDSVWVSRSGNDGVTWTTTRLIDGETDSRDYQEPYLVRQGDGLFLTFRWGNNDSIGEMFSSDAGATWSTPAAAFPGTGRPSSAWLADGTIVVYLRGPNGMFDIRATRDLGATWGPSRAVQAPPKGGMSTYASFVEVSPGKVFTVMSSQNSTETRARISFAYLGGRDV
jgi:hypothetical protein